MRVAFECAGFTASEADFLRRAITTFKLTGGDSHFKDKLINGMLTRAMSANSPRRPSARSRASDHMVSPRATLSASR